MFSGCVGLLAVMAILYYGGILKQKDQPPDFYDGAPMTILGTVCDIKQNSFTLNTISIYTNSNIIQNPSISGSDMYSIKKKNKITCDISMDNSCYLKKNDIKIGNRVVVKGEYSEFSSATNLGEFDEKKYYQTMMIIGRLKNVTILKKGNSYFKIRELLFEMRQVFSNRLYQVFPEKEAGILDKMLLGNAEGIDTNIKNLYAESGIIHILSISGLHITILGMGIYKLLKKAGCPVWLSAFIGGVFLIFYGGIAGMGISAVRAIGMYLIKMLSYVFGRTYDLLTALGMMAVILVLYNPAYLEHAGFLLSFTSLLGISILYPFLKEVMKEKDKKSVFTPFYAGLSITLMTLPIQLWFYYEIPVWSGILNLCVLPFMGVLVTVGFVVLCIPGTGILGTASCLILSYYEYVCRMFEKIPIHTWNPGRPDAYQVFGYYLLLGGGILIAEYIRKKRKRIAKLETLLLIFALFGIMNVHINKTDTVTFLDVGQGDCIIIRLKTGENYLFDCGSTTKKKVGERILLQFLKEQGIGHLDAVFLSHADKDHVNGIGELLGWAKEEHIAIGQVVFTSEDEIEEFQRLTLAPLDSYKMTRVQAGDTWRNKKTSFVCVNPPGDTVGWESNERSQVFLITFQCNERDVYLVLAADAEGKGETYMAEEIKKEISDKISPFVILKVAHHGSRFSSSEELLELIKPQVAIISSGKKNTYGHPHKETLERLKKVGARVFRTDESGSVCVKIDKRTVSVEEYK